MSATVKGIVAAVAIAASGLLLAGCGASSADTASAPATTATTSAAPATSAAPSAPQEASLLPCGVSTPIQGQVRPNMSQATLDEWQRVVTVGCPDRQGEYAMAAQAWREAQKAKVTPTPTSAPKPGPASADVRAADDAAATAAAEAAIAAAGEDPAAQRAALITAADARIQAQLVVMLGNATAPGSPAAYKAMDALLPTARAYGILERAFGGSNPDVTAAVDAAGRHYTAAGYGPGAKITDRQLIGYYGALNDSYMPVTGFDYMAQRPVFEPLWIAYGGTQPLKR